jgi:hypothetical protein
MSTPFKVYRIGDNAPHASLSLWHKLNCLNAIHLTVVRAVWSAHLGEPLASNSDSVTTVTADTFEQAGCLFLLSVRGHKVSMRINAEPSQHGFCPSFKRFARMSGCQLTLKANGTGSFTEF